MDINLTNIFKNVGFDEKEAKTYLALLAIGRGTATEIAEHSQLKRAIVYHILERLKKRGYAQELPGSKIKQYSPTDPNKVLQNVSSATESLRIVMPIIKALQDKGQEKPRIEFLEGKEAVLSMYKVYAEAKNIRYFSSMKRLYDLFPEEVESWTERRLKLGTKNITEKHLVNDTKFDREWVKFINKVGQEGRILPEKFIIEMDFAITKDFLGITSFDPLYIVVIHSEGIARSAAQLFDLAWLQGRKP